MTNLFMHPRHEVQDWESPEFSKAGIEVKVLRGDLFHPWMQGNKWYKLRHFARLAESNNASGFVSIGGPWSNHLQALGSYAAERNLRSLFFIRGEEREWAHHPPVIRLRSLGACLFPISRSDFRLATEGEVFLKDFLPDSESPRLIEVPLGATSPETIEHTIEWAEYLKSCFDFTDLILPVASGGTLAGMLAGLPKNIRIHGIDVLNSKGGLVKTTQDLLKKAGIQARAELQWHPDYHFGSYARNSPALLTFMKGLRTNQNIPSEHVYSGKAFYAVSDLADKGHFSRGSKLLVLHTGGLFQWS